MNVGVSSALKITAYTVTSLLAALSALAQAGVGAPQVEIANKVIRVKVYVPDSRNGYYRGTRFDWSGVIADLQYRGHSYYGPWFARMDPKVRDFVYEGSDIVAGPCSAITGPAEEFTPALGYEDAKPGGTFVKIGVGVLAKPDNAKYDSYRLYDIVDSGKWAVSKSAASIEFTQTIHDPSSGYGYVYRKTIRLIEGKPEMVIEHSLRNVGTRSIDTRVYDHNFLVLDKQPPGPAFTITLPFKISTDPPLSAELADVHLNQIRYLKELTGEDRVYGGIKGFGKSSDAYKIRISNSQVRAGMTISGDRSLSSMSLWSIRSVLAVEPFIDISIEPGSEWTWKYTYEYDTHTP